MNSRGIVCLIERNLRGRLVTVTQTPHMHLMAMRDTWNRLRQNPTVRVVLFVIGCIFLIITPLLGPLPGPGGIFTFAIGLGLVLQTSAWARRRYVRFKRRYPKQGGWADWGLRRASAKRRVRNAKRDLSGND